jgi:hypothetical protein
MTYERIKIYLKENQPILKAVVCCGIMFVVGFGTGQKFKAPKPDNRPKQTNSTTNSAFGQTSNANIPANIAPRQEVTQPAPTTQPETTDAVAATPTTATDSPATIPKPIAAPPKTLPANPTPENCPVKGSKSKIYHVEGGAFYERTKPAQCFNTAEEAEAAGFRKSAR